MCAKTVGLVLAAILLSTSHPSLAQTSTSTRYYPPEIAQHLDLSVNPCDDFYKFSCGGWSRDFQMPSDSTSYSLFSDSVKDKNREVLLTILKSNKAPGVTKYFNSCMNTKRINQLGSTPVQKVIQQIDAVKNVVELFQVAGELILVNFNFLSAMLVGVDKKQASQNILQVKQALLTFLSRSTYLVDDIFVVLEPVYREYISTVLTQAQLAHSSDVNALVDTIVELEQSIAKIMWTVKNSVDPVLSYNRMTFQEASTKYPLSFKAVASGMFAKAGVAFPAKTKPVIIRTPSYFEKLENLLKSTDLAALKILMKYQYINAKNDLLSDVFTTAGFELHDIKLEGMSERPSREKFCVDLLIKQLPNRMGKEYAALMFDADSGNLAKDMIARVEAVMKQRLLTVDWLDASTRKSALQKLDKVTNLISHSDQVEELDGVTLNADEFFGNTDAILKWKNLQQLRKLNKPVVRGEWPISGSEVNAYYQPSHNTMALPAGILQPPFFSKSNLAAINYGATGAVMGHELIHAFDNSGRLIDGDGNMVSWWSDQTSAVFDKRTQCLVDQYSKFEVVSDFNSSLVLGKVNGKRSLDENIADVSGFSIAFEAYQKFIEQATPQDEEPLPEMDIQVSVDGLPHQRRQRQLNDEPSKTELEKLFYVAFAQSWCVVKRNGLEDMGWNVHAPPYFRVTGTIMNNQYFGQLFNCPVGTKMNPKDKCSVW